MAQTENIRQMVRLVDQTIPGTRKVLMALADIKGIGMTMAHAICHVLNIDERAKIGALTDEELEKIHDAVKYPLKHNIPVWMINRRRDYETGENMHLHGADLAFYVGNDIKIMKKIKSFKGMRHAAGQPVRGQSTKAHFRHGSSLGVVKKKAPAAGGKA
ncbi:MAG: 30S ribosomal protein S13 [Candidatus Nanoarchaeia archaeon]|nr:30S ribosomal protein S13 [Candidatus Nanoarchaeia archaeon]